MGARPGPPSPELVELAQTEPVGILDDHHRGVGEVDPDLDHVVATSTSISPALIARITDSASRATASARGSTPPAAR